jgi:hypothetical protein
MVYMNGSTLIPEVPIKIVRAKFDTDTYDKAIRCGKCDNDTNTYYKYDKHMFTIDGCDRSNRIIKEFNGCYFHGCRKCFPECKATYNKTMEENTCWNLLDTKSKPCGIASGTPSKRTYQTNQTLKTKQENKTLEHEML